MLDIEVIIKHTFGLKLLYVEDNDEARESTLSILEEFFKDIIVACNGEEGLELFKESEIDLIITDINMPKLNGLKMIQEIKKIDNEVPILVLSAHNEPAFFMQSIKLGVDGYLLKPTEIDQLISIFDKVTQNFILKKEREENNHLMNQYQEATDQSSIVSKTDVNGKITYANDKFCEISGYSREELIGKNHNIVRHPDMPSSAFKDMWNTIKNKKETWQGMVKNLAKDGTPYYVKATVKPITDKAGNILEYISLRVDITKIINLKNEVKELHTYDIEQQHAAKEKIELGIKNDMHSDEARVIYAPLDILSGDFYSLHKRKDGSTFIYIIDGQGHGISPSLTIFSISSVINNVINRVTTFKEIIDRVFPAVKTFLGEIEQLSYSMVMISPDSKTISYASGGMYPFLIKTAQEVKKIKVNNLPFMNFSQNPIISEITMQQWDSLLMFSDGFIEHENSNFDEFTPMDVINKPSLIDNVEHMINNTKLEDDTTMIYLVNGGK